jgi:hypothetical protein
MRPDVALAFDRMEAAARVDGVTPLITSAFRTDAEQAAPWARNPDRKKVARPGTSLHRHATEFELGPASAYGRLAQNAGRFHFAQRYVCEPSPVSLRRHRLRIGSPRSILVSVIGRARRRCEARRSRLSSLIDEQPEWPVVSPLVV